MTEKGKNLLSKWFDKYSDAFHEKYPGRNMNDSERNFLLAIGRIRFPDSNGRVLNDDDDLKIISSIQ